MDARKYLMQYAEKQQEIKRIEYRLAELEAQSEGGAVNYDGMPRSSTPGKLAERIVIAHSDLVCRYLEAKREAADIMGEVVDTIEKVSDTLEKDVLQARYITVGKGGRLRNWDTIAKKLADDDPAETYSVSYLLRIHHRGLDSVQQILDSQR